jgi:hypothetical protein
MIKLPIARESESNALICEQLVIAVNSEASAEQVQAARDRRPDMDKDSRLQT